MFVGCRADHQHKNPFLLVPPFFYMLCILAEESFPTTYHGSVVWVNSWPKWSAYPAYPLELTRDEAYIAVYLMYLPYCAYDSYSATRYDLWTTVGKTLLSVDVHSPENHHRRLFVQLTSIRSHYSAITHLQMQQNDHPSAVRIVLTKHGFQKTVSSVL